MVIERFSQNIINSGIFKLYEATGFFAILIFFVLNAEIYTPTEIVMGVVGVTIVLKGLTNMMLSLVILLFNLDNKQKELDFQYQTENIEALLSELSIKEADLKNEAAK